MDIGTYISLAAVAISLAALLRNTQNDGKADAATTARNQARQEAKLDNISSAVDDIRAELRASRAEAKDFSGRLAGLEARVDNLEKGEAQ